MNSHKPQLIVADATGGHKHALWAVGLSLVLGPLPATLLATLVAAWVGEPAHPWIAAGTVVGLFGGSVVLVLVILRLIGGAGSVTRRRAVPWVLAAELVALAVGAALGVPREVFAAFAAFFVVGLVALAGARTNVSAHCLMAGALVGLLLAWAPPLGATGVLALLALARARVALRQHTAPQAVTGAVVGLVAGVVAGLVA